MVLARAPGKLQQWIKKEIIIAAININLAVMEAATSCRYHTATQQAVRKRI